MKVKLTIDGKEFEVEMDDNEAKAMLSLKTLCEKKKTGYERVEKGEIYYAELDDGTTYCYEGSYAEKNYEDANYYLDRTVAENNARADKLYRQLRRFAVEHRKEILDWNDGDIGKVFLYYNHSINKIDYATSFLRHEYGNIYFNSEETAKLAIETFKDELIWYFTEYKDSL